MKIKTGAGKLILPKGFRLFSTDYRVEVNDIICDENSALGLFSENLKKILITTRKGLDELPHDAILETYYHEVAHVFMKALGEEELFKNEKFIGLLGKVLMQYLETVKY